MADEKPKIPTDAERLQAKFDGAKEPLQKARYKFQLDILKAGDDKAAAAKIRGEYMATKTKILAERAAKKKAAAAPAEKPAAAPAEKPAAAAPKSAPGRR